MQHILLFTVRRIAVSAPAGTLALLASLALLIGAGIAYAAQAHVQRQLQTELQRLPDRPATAANKPGLSDRLDLPDFQPMALPGELDAAAHATGLEFGEVSYVLEKAASQGFLRYRATLKVTSSYPVIRRFVDRLQARQPHLALTAINCSKDDIGIGELDCELSLSAFFRKP
ncbi:hypothetical protein [Chitinimonas koreensis]|uniref:hypothetical protein n=1 Tax=Chitinimonas koreensis TaxID=356302 RepID=UPI000491D4CA|nr:hypothetical protein [Chitinimonas koreensis]QNM94823.1 hypothetical protein H9L41_12850 [Chitinimonas koreensis]